MLPQVFTHQHDWLPLVSAHIIPGLFLISISYIGVDPYVCVAIITLSLGFNGAATMTNLQNAQDLAPNFAGSLYGMVNFVGTTSGFISPLIVAHFTAEKVEKLIWHSNQVINHIFNHQSTLDEWQYVFYIGAAAYIIPALLFMVFGDGNVQKWNEPKSKDTKNAIDTRL